MTDDGSPPIEIIADETDDGAVRAPPDRNWHRMALTASAVIAALALLWIATSVAGLRANSDRQECRQEVETRRWMLEEEFHRLGSPGDFELDPDDLEMLLDEANRCGLDDIADALERRYGPDEDDADTD